MSEIALIAVLALFPVSMMLASIYDLFTMTIPNRITLALTISFFVLAPIAGLPFEAMFWHVGLGFGVLVACYGLFVLGVMGGGDAKLLAASALWLGPGVTLQYLLLAAFAGGVVTLAILVLRRNALPCSLLKVEWVTRLHDDRNGVPYGMALGPAALFVFPESVWMAML
ncbi:MAG: prepilin peptidase [Ahrensia sp.]|nr:prepilin peptidase [Ahrensia sp.]